MLSKAFPGVQASSAVSFDLQAGEIHALMGENGAGKSTLMKILAGVYSEDSGEIMLSGERVTVSSPRNAQHLGVGIVHQELNLMNHLTAAQNIFIGREPRGRFGLLDEKALNKQALALFARLNLRLDPQTLVGDLTVARQQMVEIAKALSFEDSKAATPLLKKAQASKIPVVAFDSGVDSDIPVTTATTDNIAAAGLAADKMAELIGNEGEVAVVVHDQTSRTGIDRRDGFVNRIKANYPKIKVVSVQYGGGDHLKSTEITKSILLANPKLKGMFGANEGSAIGVLNGAKEMKRKIVIIGYDSGKQQKAAVASGEMAGAITQNPVGIGYKTVEAAVKALKGEKLPKIIDTGFYYYDKNNMNDPKIAAVLYD